MKELKIQQPETSSDNTYILCECGALIYIDPVEVFRAGNILVNCHICRAQIIVMAVATDGDCV